MELPGNLPAPPDEREVIRAEALLARLEFHAELAELYETETSARLRERYADRYRRLLGVAPEQRQALQAALAGVVAGSGQRVAGVLQDLAREQRS